MIFLISLTTSFSTTCTVADKCPGATNNIQCCIQSDPSSGNACRPCGSYVKVTSLGRLLVMEILSIQLLKLNENIIEYRNKR